MQPCSNKHHRTIWALLPILLFVCLTFLFQAPIMCMPKVCTTRMLWVDKMTLLFLIYVSFSQYETVGMIPKQRFDEQLVIYAFTERVIDGDTIRVRHIPNYRLRHILLRYFYNHQQTLQPLQQRGIAQETLSIRLYGVDCPELAKKKHQITQPYAEEAKAFTTQLCHHRVVKITLLRKDQYQRAVAIVQVVPNGWFRRRPNDLSIALAHAGLAELYTGGGAEYGNKREALEHAIQQAQRKRKGIWSLQQRISAAEYKQTLKEAAPKSHRTPPRKKTLLETAITGLELVG